MVPDPYRALGLSHKATSTQIKSAYRKLALKYHPDRVTKSISSGDISPSSNETKEAADRFSAIAAAYQLLSDPIKKRQYDHIYKYGGYDDIDENQKSYDRRRTSSSSPSQSQPCRPYPPSTNSDNSPFNRTSNGSRQRNGIGYTVVDPFSFIMSLGKHKSAAVAGIQIPSRIHLSRGAPGGGVTISFSSGQYTKLSDGGRIYVSKSTQYVEGKKYCRSETTTVHPDGRKEVVIEGDNYIERRYSNVKRKRPTSPAILHRSETGEDVTHAGDGESNLPWYMEAWQTCREKLSMCHNPCSCVTLAH